MDRRRLGMGPIGERIYDELRGRVCTGQWQEGKLIPTEKQLVAELSCSRSTVSKVLAQMAREGILERKTRAGTRVVRNPDGRPPRAPDPKRLSFDAVAFIYPGAQHEGIRRIMQGFQAAAHAAARRVVMLSTGLDTRREAEVVGRLGEFDVRGAALYPVIPRVEDYIYHLQMIHACAFPVVLAGTSLPATDRPAALLDGFHAGWTATRHLLAKGARRLGFFGNYAWTLPSREKYLGFRQAMEEAGLEPAGVLLENAMNPNFDDPLVEPMLLAQRFLERFPGVDGVVCSSDFLGAGLIRVARAGGRDVPGDLRISGTSDLSCLADETPRLSSYHTPYEHIGQRAFQMLEAQLQGKVSDPLEQQLRGHMVERQST